MTTIRRRAGRARHDHPPHRGRNARAAAPARRVLVTGSRAWVNPVVVRAALAQVWGEGDAVLVTGACPSGADRIAEMFWRRWGGRVERHPAQWQLHGNRAGFVRNQAMVAAGADVCVAFVRDHSPGASHTVHLAEHAGIPVFLHTDTSPALPDGHGPESSSGPGTDPDSPLDTGSETAGAGQEPGAPRPATPAPAGTPKAPAGRVWLDVPYTSKNAAKRLGARWDPDARRWYAPAGLTEDLRCWAASPQSADPAPRRVASSVVRSPHPGRAATSDTAAAATAPPDRLESGRRDAGERAVTDARAAVDRLHQRPGQDDPHRARRPSRWPATDQRRPGAGPDDAHEPGHGHDGQR